MDKALLDLADNLGISRTEARQIIDNYKKQFANIQKYMDDTINFAREYGFVQTLMGRKRWLKDINSAPTSPCAVLPNATPSTRPYRVLPRI